MTGASKLKYQYHR